MKPLLPRSVLLMLSGILLVLFAASPASGQTDSLPPSGSSITEPSADNMFLEAPIVLGSDAVDETSIAEVRV